MAHNDRRKIHEECGREVAHTLDGRPYAHKCFRPEVGPEGFEDPTPRGTTKFPALPETVADGQEGPVTVGMADTDKGTYEGEKGPWFGALYDGRCSSCEDEISEGDRIRADGLGGYECEDCEGIEMIGDELDPEQPLVDGWKTSEGVDDDFDPTAWLTERGAAAANWQAQASAAAKRHAEGQQPTPAAPDDAQAFMEFEDPTTPADRPKKINVSGQPEAERDWLKRYIVRDPATGDFRWLKNGNKEGVTRVTTFNKAAQNSKGLHDWANRNVVIGASMRPDILRGAHGLRHDNGDDATDKVHRDALNRIVAQLSEAAGAKVSADEGSYLHEETELIDAGLKTWRESPAAYQQDLKRYVEALEKHGLVPVPGLIERTTMINEFGGVCGTFDRICYHRPSDSYVVVDLKTGKTMKYAMDETETQLWCYAHGVNQNGIYDWNTHTWLPPGTYGDSMEAGPWQVPMKVREDVGVIIHMPVQGPEAGTVNVLLADLEAGKAHAELCHAVRSKPKRKPAPWASWAAPVPQPPTLEEMFAAVRDKEHATELWRDAKIAGIEGVRLNELIRIAREALAGKG